MPSTPNRSNPPKSPMEPFGGRIVECADLDAAIKEASRDMGYDVGYCVAPRYSAPNDSRGGLHVGLRG